MTKKVIIEIKTTLVDSNDEIVKHKAISDEIELDDRVVFDQDSVRMASDKILENARRNLQDYTRDLFSEG